MADNDTPRKADFVGQVVSDANNPPETRMLTGWLGDAGEKGFTRLYTDAELNNYVDIPDDAILYTEPIRDVQPAGGVFVWIKRDAALKQGGSAANRAARFLQGQVQQDFASSGGAAAAAVSPEKAGLRCITQVPCGEPTGFTGECTKQPEVGGAWPCITAAPHCYEVTGFTGKCTHQPWPNPTRYIGCTILHCPTQDLTNIPRICNIVATGLPGCGGVEPPQGGINEKAVAAEGAEAERPAPPATQLPGCGYTKTWGLCETHLLGCPATKDCPPTLDCPEQFRGAGQVGQQASIICATAIGCDITVFCPTRFRPLCFPTLICPTQPQQCFPIQTRACPVTAGCPIGGTPVQGGGFAAFGAGPGIIPNTQIGGGCNTMPAVCPSGVVPCPTNFECETKPITELCTKFLAACETKAAEWCPPTKVPHFCPDTSCGPKCQTQQVGGCPPTQFGPPCPSQFGTVCPSPPPECTMFCTNAGPNCPQTVQPPACPPSDLVACHTPTPPVCFEPQRVAAQAFGARMQTLAGCSLLPGCPRAVQIPQTANCPTPGIDCTSWPGCRTQPNGDCTFFGNCPTNAQQIGAAGPITVCTQSGPQCPPTPATVCTQFGPQCPTQPNGDCTFFGGCPTNAQIGAAGPITICTQSGPQCPPTPATVCTQLGPQCPTQPNGDCTFFGGCPTNAQVGAAGPITICTQSGPQCPTHQPPCTFTGPACPPTPGIICTQFGQQCPTQPKGDCTFFGGCPTNAQVDAAGRVITVCTQSGPQCPTHQFPCTIAGPACPPTPGIICTQFGPQCPTRQWPCTHLGPQCPPTPATICTLLGQQCPSPGFECTQFGPQCPTQPPGDCTFFGCPTNAQVGAAGPVTICTQSGPQCPTHQLPCTHQGPICPPTPATICTQFGQQCPSPGFECTMFCTQSGPQCPQTIQAPACPITIGGPQCPPASGVQCPSPFCPPGGWQQQGDPAQQLGAVGAAIQPGGGGWGAPLQTSFCVVPTALCRSTLCPTQIVQQCPPSQIVKCPPTPGCPSPFVKCPPSPVFDCPTEAAICPITPVRQCPPSQVVWQCPQTPVVKCPTHPLFGCPQTFAQPCGPTSLQWGCPNPSAQPNCPPPTIAGFAC